MDKTCRLLLTCHKICYKHTLLFSAAASTDFVQRESQAAFQHDPLRASKTQTANTLRDDFLKKMNLKPRQADKSPKTGRFKELSAREITRAGSAQTTTWWWTCLPSRSQINNGSAHKLTSFKKEADS
eukprot:269211-Amphidinium_carterae.1